jgi:hypothetical protein
MIFGPHSSWVSQMQVAFACSGEWQVAVVDANCFMRTFVALACSLSPVACPPFFIFLILLIYYILVLLFVLRALTDVTLVLLLISAVSSAARLTCCHILVYAFHNTTSKNLWFK